MMKRVLAAVLCISLLLCLWVPPASAAAVEGTCGESLTWTLDTDGTLTISGTGKMADFPAAAPWAAYKMQILSLSVAEGVTTLGNAAFSGCSRLSDVALPGSLTAIGDEAFRACHALTQISVPNNVTRLGDRAFFACSALSKVQLPAKLKSIGGSAFESCSALTALIIPNGVAEISSGAFRDCTALAHMELPGSVKHVTAGLFSGCESLKSVVLGDGIESIASGAFSSCGLESVSIPASVKTVYQTAFQECWALKTAEIAAEEVGVAAFLDCGALASVTFEKTVKKLGKNIFGGCSSLTDVAFFGAKPELAANTFNEVTATVSYPEEKTITWTDAARQDYGGELTWQQRHDPELVSAVEPTCTAAGNPAYWRCLVCGKCFSDADGETEISRPTLPALAHSWGEGQIITAPTTAAEGIRRVACTRCNAARTEPIAKLPSGVLLTEGTCGEGLTWRLDDNGVLTVSGTGKMADFPAAAPWAANREDITSVVLAEGVETIGQRAFADCAALTAVEMPGSLTSIGREAFFSCAVLTSLRIPKHVEKIGDEAFYGCTALTGIWVDAENAAFCSDACGVLYSKDKSALLHAPISAALGDYAIPESVTELAPYAFECRTGLTGVRIPEGVAEIGELAFYGCTALKTAVLPSSLTYVGESAFNGCTALVSACFLGDAPELGWGAFQVYDADANEDVNIRGLTLYYIAGKTGWTTPTYGEAAYQTATWDGINVPQPSHEHKYRAVVTRPTCTEGGYTTYTCRICGDQYVADPVPPKGHNMVLDAEIAPTCTKPGRSIGTRCTVCKVVFLASTVLPALGHAWDDGTVTLRPTTVREGIRTFTCTRCEATRTEPIDRLQITVPFRDVDKDAYYAAAVEWAVAEQITNGMTADTFAPEAACTRGQIVTFLWRAAGEPTPRGTKNPFTDIRQSDYYYTAVLWAAEQGITTGTTEATFSPEAGCTRGQVATFLWRSAGRPVSGGGNPFADVGAGAFYYDAVLWAVENGITNGTGSTTFSPEDTCTRAQIVTFLYRYLA